jgi:hypothetical protein
MPKAVVHGGSCSIAPLHYALLIGIGHRALSVGHCRLRE